MLYKKHKTTLVACMLLVWILSPALCLGEMGSPGKWWRLPQVTEKLNLNENQKTQLDELFVKSHRKMIDLKATVQKERFELDNLLDKQTLDEAAIMTQYDKLKRARIIMGDERFMFLLEVRKIIGPERYQELKVLFREFRGKHHRGKHGMQQP